MAGGRFRAESGAAGSAAVFVEAVEGAAPAFPRGDDMEGDVVNGESGLGEFRFAAAFARTAAAFTLWTFWTAEPAAAGFELELITPPPAFPKTKARKIAVTATTCGG